MPVHARCLYTVGIFADVLTCYTRVKDLLLRTRLRNNIRFSAAKLDFVAKYLMKLHLSCYSLGWCPLPINVISLPKTSVVPVSVSSVTFSLIGSIAPLFLLPHQQHKGPFELPHHFTFLLQLVSRMQILKYQTGKRINIRTIQSRQRG